MNFGSHPDAMAALTGIVLALAVVVNLFVVLSQLLGRNVIGRRGAPVKVSELLICGAAASLALLPGWLTGVFGAAFDPDVIDFLSSVVPVMSVLALAFLVVNSSLVIWRICKTSSSRIV